MKPVVPLFMDEWDFREVGGGPYLTTLGVECIREIFVQNQCYSCLLPLRNLMDWRSTSDVGALSPFVLLNGSADHMVQFGGGAGVAVHWRCVFEKARVQQGAAISTVSAA